MTMPEPKPTADETSKRPYRTPELRNLGSVTELTQSGPGPGANDGSGGYGS
jgi:hypothetical protein